MSSQPLRTEAISRFLHAKTHKDLAELYNHNMEVQVNVAQGNGKRIDSTYKGKSFMAWSDGVETWKSFRIPYNASSDPEYEDKPMTFNLEKHVEGIGCTGWDWVNRVSRWFGYDFDAIIGHSDRHTRKSTDEELKEIEKVLERISWVTLRYSTSGRGLHLYVFVPEIHTANHNEHAALARSILGQLSAHVGYDFGSKVDTCGGNMWIWHRKMENNNGLMLIKPGTVFTEIPPNWRDHIPVVKGDRRKISMVNFNNTDEVDMFEELTSKSPLIELDEHHKKHFDWLANNGAYWYWDNDRRMLVTHTFHLQEMHVDLGLKGIFRTMSQGTERGTDGNCFCFPLRKGAWAVRRFTPGVAEDPSWTQDGAGWTRCYLNREPDLATMALANGGKEKGNGAFVFDDAKSAMDTAIALGAEVDISPMVMNRQTTLKLRKTDRKLVMEIARETNDTNDRMQSWIAEGKKWQRVLNVKAPTLPEPEINDYDEVVRHLVTSMNEEAGWVLRTDRWIVEPLNHITLALKAQGYDAKDVQLIQGNAVLRNWSLVNIPFQPEYPGGRVWNRNAAQFRFKPALDKLKFETPNWDRLLYHLGRGLDDAIADNEWAKSNGITRGGDYLRCWIASMFQHPFEPLPYLFFYSKEQGTGKSTFHEALSLLLSQGAVMPASTALVSEQSFNAELATSVLCVVEELELGNGKGKANAYNRIKDWVTSRMMLIHPKGQTPYSIPNTTHWVQCSNNHLACPIFPGDTRITMINVPRIPAGEQIPKKNLLELLVDEGPDFLGMMLKLEIPPSNDRLFVPVINTQSKELAAEANKTPVETFLEEHCYKVDGEMIKFSDFYDKFTQWMPEAPVSKIQLSKELPTDVVYGRSSRNNQRYVANYSFDKIPATKPRIVVKEGILYANGRPV